MLSKGIWNIIKGWLDPVVASKVHFTYTAYDLEKFIPRNRIIKELEGVDDWQYKYIEPHPDENKKMEDTATRDKIIARRAELSKEVEQATIAWIKAADTQNADVKFAAEDKRNGVIDQLTALYWELDPYIRARTLYDRYGVIQPGGKINFYPEKENNSASTTNSTETPAKTEEVAAKDETAP